MAIAPDLFPTASSATLREKSSHSNGNGHDTNLGAELAAFDQNDIGNARRLIHRYGQRLRYVVNVGWHIWDGKRWKIDEGEVATRKLAQQTARSIIEEVAFVQDQKAQAARVKWMISSGYTTRIKGMMEQAQPHVALTIDDLDADPWLFNCDNGTLDLRTGTLQPFDPQNLITKQSPIAFEPDAVCPAWDRFMVEIFADDAAMVEFTHRALGYSLTGITREHVIFILHGSGSNGKSVLLETVAAILADYTRQCPSETFAQKDKGGGMSNDIARLAGSRLVSVVETDQERRLAEGLVKQATGGDRMAARYLHHEFFEFVPKFKLWLATNHKPKIRGTDNGIWRRIRLLPFLVTFEDSETAALGAAVKDDQLKEKLVLELPGILARIVRGCLDWQEIGLKMPEAVINATADYRASQDALVAFIPECCIVASSVSIKFGELYDGYKRWCAENREDPISSKAFGDRLDEKGFSPDRSGHGGSRVRAGITLNASWSAQKNQ